MTSPKQLLQELIDKGIIPDKKTTECVLWQWAEALMKTQQEFKIDKKTQIRIKNLVCLCCIFDDCIRKY